MNEKEKASDLLDWLVKVIRKEEQEKQIKQAIPEGLNWKGINEYSTIN